MKISVTYAGNPYEVIGEIDYNDITMFGEAYPTSRVLDGCFDGWASQEWLEFCFDKAGETYSAVYLFDGDEVEAAGEYSENLPFNVDHIARLEIQ